MFLNSQDINSQEINIVSSKNYLKLCLDMIKTGKYGWIIMILKDKQYHVNSKKKLIMKKKLVHSWNFA